MSRSYHNGVWAKHSKAPYDRWLSSEPKEWRRLQKHKKRRSAFRTLKHQILKGAVDLDEVLMPLDCKPWIYYW